MRLRILAAYSICLRILETSSGFLLPTDIRMRAGCVTRIPGAVANHVAYMNAERLQLRCRAVLSIISQPEYMCPKPRHQSWNSAIADVIGADKSFVPITCRVIVDAQDHNVENRKRCQPCTLWVRARYRDGITTACNGRINACAQLD